MPFTVTVNMTGRKGRFAVPSFEIVHHRMAFLPSGRSDGASRDWRFDSVSRRGIRSLRQRARFLVLKSFDAFGSRRFGLGANEIHFASLHINRLKTPINCLSRVCNIAVEFGEFPGVFWRQTGDYRLSKSCLVHFRHSSLWFIPCPVVAVHSAVASFGVSQFARNKFIPGVLRDPGPLLQMFLDVGD